MSARIIHGYTRNELLTMRNAMIMYLAAIDEMKGKGPLVAIDRHTLKSREVNSLDGVIGEVKLILDDILVALTEESVGGRG